MRSLRAFAMISALLGVSGGLPAAAHNPDGPEPDPDPRDPRSPDRKDPEPVEEPAVGPIPDEPPAPRGRIIVQFGSRAVDADDMQLTEAQQRHLDAVRAHAASLREKRERAQAERKANADRYYANRPFQKIPQTPEGHERARKAEEKRQRKAAKHTGTAPTT